MYIERTIDNLLLKTVMIEYINGISMIVQIAWSLLYLKLCKKEPNFWDIFILLTTHKFKFWISFRFFLTSILAMKRSIALLKNSFFYVFLEKFTTKFIFCVIIFWHKVGKWWRDFWSNKILKFGKRNKQLSLLHSIII